MWYIIDGYNLLFFKQSKFKDFTEEREDLIHLLDRFSTSKELSLTLVFDAQYQSELQVRTHRRNLEIIYTDPGQTADEAIVDLLEHASKPKNTTLVTSDKPLARKARQLGAKTLSNTEFLKLLSKQQGVPPSPTEPPKQKHLEQHSPEFERWLNLFEKRYRRKED